MLIFGELFFDLCLFDIMKDFDYVIGFICVGKNVEVDVYVIKYWFG